MAGRSQSPSRSPQPDSGKKGSEIRHFLLAIYLGVGFLLTYFFARSGFASVEELTIPALVTATLVITYELLDVMGLGISKQGETKLLKEWHKCNVSDMPLKVQLALRVQTNQVEQMTGFLASMWTFSVFVNGRIGGVLGAIWLLLRILYAREYRDPTLTQRNLIRFTIPCYMIVNIMAGSVFTLMAQRLVQQLTA